MPLSSGNRGRHHSQFAGQDLDVRSRGQGILVDFVHLPIDIHRIAVAARGRAGIHDDSRTKRRVGLAEQVLETDVDPLVAGSIDVGEIVAEDSVPQGCGIQCAPPVR